MNHEWIFKGFYYVIFRISGKKKKGAISTPFFLSPLRQRIDLASWIFIIHKHIKKKKKNREFSSRFFFLKTLPNDWNLFLQMSLLIFEFLKGFLSLGSDPFQIIKKKKEIPLSDLRWRIKKNLLSDLHKRKFHSLKKFPGKKIT